jgi:hypothetical protein
MNPTPSSRIALRSAACLAAVVALVLAACSTSSPSQRTGNVAANPSTSEQHYKDLIVSDEVNDLLDEIERNALGTVAATPARSPAFEDTTPPPSANLSKSYEVEPATANPKTTFTPAETSIAAIDEYRARPAAPEARRRELVDQLAGMLRDDANSPEWPVPALVRLAALDLIEPGTFNSFYISESSGAMTNLHPRDVQSLSAWRDLFGNARRSFSQDAENADIASIAQRFADHLTQQHALRVPTVKLCTKVDGFGLYTALPKFDDAYKLLAGRRHRLIVYVEVDRFSHQETMQDGQSGYAVELLQDLSLYHTGDREDTLAWRKPNQAINDWSRNQRRDFFVVQIIELPETLTVGTYRLKIRMTDEGADPPAEDETSIRIEVVADASAFQR